MEGKKKDHGMLARHNGMLQTLGCNPSNNSKKRKREQQGVGSGQAPGLPPKSSKCTKHLGKKRIKYLQKKMGGGCSFPTSKNVVEPVVKKENFNGPERSKSRDTKVSEVPPASPLAARQLNIDRSGSSRKGSLYGTHNSKDSETPLLQPEVEQDNIDLRVTYQPNANGAEMRNDGIERPAVEDVVSKHSETSKMTSGVSSSQVNLLTTKKMGFPTASSLGDISGENTKYSNNNNNSITTELYPPDCVRMRTSLSESDSVFVAESELRDSELGERHNSFVSSDESLTRSKSHDFALRYSVGSADLINNCCRGSVHLRPHNQPRAASISGASVELHQTASPRYRRNPTVENSVCYQEDDQINYYQILEEIGRGSYGSVYKCFSYKDTKYYAMKVISKKRLIRKTGLVARHPKKGKANPLDSLHREIAILKKVDHPNVVRLVEVIDDPQIDNVYMVFEIMEKGPIIEIPAENPLTEERTRAYFRDVVLGMEYLHFSKIIHRDIKPSNLLLGDDGHVKIADFGVSDMFEDDDDMLSKFAGSPAFQSPEAITGTRDKFSGKAADIWALGVTLFSCIYGECPFFSNDIFKLYDMIKTNDVAFPEEPTVDPQFQDLVSRMLAKDPKTRITIAEIKKHPWITRGGSEPLPPTDAHCVVIEVTEDEVKKSVKLISKLSSLVLMKSMIRRRRLSNARPVQNKIRSHSSPEFVVESTQQGTVKSDTLAP